MLIIATYLGVNNTYNVSQGNNCTLMFLIQSNN